jgi:hypothetical protein
MLKYILFFLLILIVLYLFKKNIAQSKLPKTDDAINVQDKKSEKVDDLIEDMVQCTSCSVHLPRSEAFLVGGKFYCSQAHIKRK